MYKQPVVETDSLKITGQTLCTSSQFGGDTSDITPPGGEIIAY